MGLRFAFGSNLSIEEPGPVSYQAGTKEKLLGDFIRKYNVRDKVFSELTFANSPLEESIAALDEIRKAGKTKYIGLAECSARTLRTTNSIAKIDAIQAECTHASRRCTERGGLILTCKGLAVAFIASGPLGHGWLVDNFPYKIPEDIAVGRFLRRQNYKTISSRRGCTLSQIALAWVAAQGLIAIPGTTKARRLEENRASRHIELTVEEKQVTREIIDSVKPRAGWNTAHLSLNAREGRLALDHGLYWSTITLS
ncbi:NADP-dependent oxidoreductase domain-containing protein [Aspergillus desertorum]